jgi:hypothetical protein
MIILEHPEGFQGCFCSFLHSTPLYSIVNTVLVLSHVIIHNSSPEACLVLSCLASYFFFFFFSFLFFLFPFPSLPLDSDFLFPIFLFLISYFLFFFFFWIWLIPALHQDLPFYFLFLFLFLFSFFPLRGRAMLSMLS